MMEKTCEMKNKTNRGIIMFSLRNYNIEITIKKDKLEDFIMAETVNQFDKIYFCHDDYEKNIMTEREYYEFEKENPIMIDFVTELVNSF